MKEQDFTKRISMVVRDDLEEWQILNTVAHISAYFGNRLGEHFGTGDCFISADAVCLPRNTQYPIIVLSGKSEQLDCLARKVRDADLQSMFFIREMVETSNDNNISASVGSKRESEIEYLGVGVFGDNQEVKRLTGQFRLWK
ncbi:DUF2000 domain-containing protein [Patescibacteria group bacterium]|nr:DUF2000 domain-containing protein [Patescibacteria group bacterium]